MKARIYAHDKCVYFENAESGNLAPLGGWSIRFVRPLAWPAYGRREEEVDGLCTLAEAIRERQPQPLGFVGPFGEGK